MRIDLAKLSRLQVLKLALLGFCLSIVPFIVGALLGLGAFVVTPVLGAALSIACGMIATRIAPRTAWEAGLVLALAVAATYVILFCGIVGTLAVLNHNGIGSAAGQIGAAAVVSLVPLAGASACIALGTWLGLRLIDRAR
ncbi:MAG: hypothetical protein WDM92_14855 [Caulobacteraceae bacterium]